MKAGGSSCVARNPGGDTADIVDDARKCSSSHILNRDNTLAFPYVFAKKG